MTALSTHILDGHLLRPRPKKLVPASIWKRILNILLDYVGTILFFSVILFIISFFSEIPIRENLQHNRIAHPYAFQMLGLFAMYVYYVASEFYLEGKTFGKYLTQTKVVTMDGRPPELKKILLRSLLRFLPFEAISLLFLKNHTWHDQWSGTMVIID